MRNDIRNSYTAADGLPIKLINDSELMNHIKVKKEIPPIHVQFIPTNRCNLNCDFCSCSEEDRNIEISLLEAEKIINILWDLGTKAVTITGGGEPLMHPNIKEIIEMFIDYDIQVGLVTNGLLLHRSSEFIGYVTWCRISNGKNRSLTGEYWNNLSRTVIDNPKIDWAFSHVVSPNPNHDEIKRVIDFANFHDFTHVRLVADLFQTEKVDLWALREWLREKGINDRLVIYQARNKPRRGSDCYICYLKPVIGADCKVYTCCGAQYALEVPSKRMPPELCLGSAFEMQRIITHSHKPFDGSICHRCYYENYNSVLKATLSKIDHERFV